jgi:uncharacterized membrane protein
MSYTDGMENVGRAVDAAGVLVIIAGALLAAFVFARAWRAHQITPDPYREFRHSLGRAILLGLEFLVAGDIIRSVAASPTFRDLGVLAIIVAVRTWLSMTLELELSGRWPWQKSKEPAPGVSSSERGQQRAA